MNTMAGGLPQRGIGVIAEQSPQGGLCHAERRSTAAGDRSNCGAISVRGAMPPFNKIVAIFWEVFIVC